MNKHLSCHDLTCMIENGCVGVYERLITVWVVSSHAGVLFQEIILSDTLSKSRLTAAAYLRDTQGFASSFAFAKSDRLWAQSTTWPRERGNIGNRKTPY